MFQRALNLPLHENKSIFLFGPRGTGKTSWLKVTFPHCLYFDLLDFDTYNKLSAQPNRLGSLIPPDYVDWVIIDEVQRVPELLNEIHRLIEGRKIKFILTGSSARTLRRKGVNLLAGRALTYHMHPLIIQEMMGSTDIQQSGSGVPQDKGDVFSLERALNFGMLPATLSYQDPKKYLTSYVQTYVREEVMQEALTRSIGDFSRFLETASFSQGNVLNYSEIARELGLKNQVVAGYFQILEDLLIATRIDVFTQRAKRKVVAHPKFYFFDTGVYRVLRPMSLLDTQEEGDGAALETLFYQSLRAVNDYYDLGYKIYFWRTAAGTEVDFVLYGPHGLHAFEIKRSSQVSNKHMSGLKSFLQDYPEAKGHLVYLGNFTEYHGNIRAIPFKQALIDLPKILS